MTPEHDALCEHAEFHLYLIKVAIGFLKPYKGCFEIKFSDD